MEPEVSLPHSHVPASFPYLEPARSSLCSHISRPEDSSTYYPPIYIWVFEVVQGFLCEHFLTRYGCTARIY
jgi:hypothetical protein